MWLTFGQIGRAAGIDISMGARGGALDNALCENFFATLNEGAHAPTAPVVDVAGDRALKPVGWAAKNVPTCSSRR